MSATNSHPPDDSDSVDPHTDQKRDNQTERVTTRFTPSQLEAIDELVEQGEFPNRSELLRHGVSKIIDEHSESSTD